jgi:RNA polymerase sigma-70 factor (ECF subfamily)
MPLTPPELNAAQKEFKAPSEQNGFSIEDLNPQENPEREANYERIRQGLIRYFKTVRFHKERAEDLAQDVLFKAWQKRDQFDKRSSLMTWIMSIARNHGLSKIRNNIKSDYNPELAVSLDAIFGTPSKLRNPEEQLIKERELKALRQAAAVVLPSFPSEYSQIWELRVNQGISVKETAEILEIPEGTVKGDLHRVVSKIKEIMLNSETEKPKKTN